MVAPGQGKRKGRKWLWIAIGLIVLLIIIIAAATAGGGDDGDVDESTTTTAGTESTEASTTESSSPETTETPATTEASTTTTEGAEIFSDGVYLVGTDLPAGLYKGQLDGDLPGYWSITTDPNGSDIVANDIPTGQFYVEIAGGQYLTLTGVTIQDAASVTPVLTSENIGDGVYLVGTDIPAGQYKGALTDTSLPGYWGITSDPNGETIVENGIPTGQFYVEVAQGQYLKISGAIISLQ